MSSSGAISQACGECRARKIKCDLQRPSCTRCIKSGRRCPGYRDQLALRFRDETQTVVQRTKATSHSSPSVGRRTQRSLMEEAFENALSTNHLAQRGELFLLPVELFIVDVQDRATCYFFEVFDWVGASILVDGSFDYQKDSINAPLGEQALLAGMTAVGKASLANLYKSDALQHSASDDYGAALSLVSAALHDSTQLKEDPTLISIFLLSMFEMIVGQERKSIENWMDHIIGAARLLDSRERDDFLKSSSPEMFYCLRNAIITCCMCRKQSVPAIIIKLCNQMASTTRDPLSAALRDLTKIMAELTNVRQKINSGELIDPLIILSHLETIQRDLEEWVGNISPSCYYDTISTSQPFSVTSNLSVTPFKPYSHKYSQIWIANMWNEYRTTKFQIYDMVLTHLRPQAMRVDDPPEYAAARTNCLHARKQMAKISDEICCSVPYILGLLSVDASQTTVKSSFGGFIILWPLTLAALGHQFPSSTSEFAFKSFDLISRCMGIQQGIAFREYVLSSSGKYNWVDSFVPCED